MKRKDEINRVLMIRGEDHVNSNKGIDKEY